MLFLLILGHFWCSIVTSVTLSSYLSNFEKNKPKKTTKKSIKDPKEIENVKTPIKKNQKKFKKFEKNHI